MHIAMGLVNRDPGGAEYQACLLADGLRRRGHEVWLYCTEAGADPGMLRQWPAFQTRVVPRGPRLGPLRHVWNIVHLKRWLHRDRIDAAIGFLPAPHALLTAAALGTRVRILGRRSCVWSECAGYGTYDAHVPQLQRWVRRWQWRTERLVCNTEAVWESALRVEGWAPERLTIVWNGWPHAPVSDCASALPVYVARPRAEKAVDQATQAFAKAGLPLALCFGVPRWADVGILVHASRADAMSNAVGTAMAHGIPVVAFDLPGNRALLAGEGLVSRWDYAELVEMVGMLRRRAAVRRKVGQRLRERARQFFSLYAMVAWWEEIITNGGA